MKKHIFSAFLIFNSLNFVSFDTEAMEFDVDNLRFGASLDFVRIDIDDPDGNTSDEDDVSLGAVVTYAVDNNWQLRGDLFYREFDFDYGADFVGQHVESYGVSVMLQRSIGSAMFMKPYLGVGLTLSKDEYTDRAILADDDYIDTNFRDRNSDSIGFLIGGGIMFPLFEESRIGVAVNYQMPMNDGVNWFGTSLFFLY